MDELASDGPSPVASPGEPRLDSWKEIAAYLRRDISTVQRWEKREGMPVHRHLHDKLGSVYALRSELDAWSRSRTVRLSADRGSTDEASDDAFRPNAIASADFALITDFDGAPRAAAISRDGKFVAFLSNREDRTDLWVTQIGAGHFYNLTRGGDLDLANPDVRTVAFSPDGALVLFWARSPGGSTGRIGVWSVPTLGGQPRPYLDDVSEFDWSESTRLVYHTPDPGDPMFVTGIGEAPPGRQIFEGPPGHHAHFPVWSPDETFIYFVGGIVPNDMDIWRVAPAGGPAERLTFHNARLTYPVFINRRTLLYLVAGADGSGPWLHALDVRQRVTSRIASGIDHYTSLGVSGDRRRLVATRAHPKTALWRAALTETATALSSATRVGLTTAAGRSPRFGPGYLLYVSARATSDSVWKFVDGAAAELWSAPPDGQIIGAPAIAAHGARVAVSVNERGRSALYVMNADGTHARVVADAVALRGGPVWAPDGKSLAVAVADDAGVPRVCRIWMDGRPMTPIVSEYSVGPVWAPDGAFIAYSGPDIGTAFHVKAVTPDGRPYAFPDLVLTRGSRHVAFLPGTLNVVVLKGDIGHKDLWLIDLQTGAERLLTSVGRDVVVRDFDIAPDGRELVIEQVQEHSDIVRIDLPAR